MADDTIDRRLSFLWALCLETLDGSPDMVVGGHGIDCKNGFHRWTLCICTIPTILIHSVMDNSPEGVSPDLLNALSYDDIAYEEQLPVQTFNDSEPQPGSLANRIGNTKVYLLAESSVNRVGKVRW